MHRDQEHDAGLKASRHTSRKEWAPTREEQHQMEAREHARQGGRVRRTHELRSAEAERQIRELVVR